MQSANIVERKLDVTLTAVYKAAERMIRVPMTDKRGGVECKKSLCRMVANTIYWQCGVSEQQVVEGVA